ncbi:hypothetical protein ACWEKR_35455 [Nocardia sp. NPDC004573]
MFTSSTPRRVTGALGDRNLAVKKWAPVVQRLNPRITTDPYWPTLAAKLETAHESGIDVVGLLTDAAHQHPLPDEMPAAALWSRVQLQTPTSDNGATNSLTSGLTGQAESNPLMLLTDEELDQHISELHQQLALVDTDAFIFSPATYRHEEPDPEDTARRHRAAQEAIRNAQHADHQLEAAVEAAGTAATEIHNARDELAATPRYRRGHRRQLQARIDTLIVERNIRDRHHNSARTNAATLTVRQSSSPGQKTTGTTNSPGTHNHRRMNNFPKARPRPPSMKKPASAPPTSASNWTNTTPNSTAAAHWSW